MQRYDIEETLMEKRDEGEFVKFDDHQAALDAVLKEAIWAMEALQKSVLDYWSEALATDESALCVDEAASKDPRYQQAQAFLDSQIVRDYRARQERG